MHKNAHKKTLKKNVLRISHFSDALDTTGDECTERGGEGEGKEREGERVSEREREREREKERESTFEEIHIEFNELHIYTIY